MASKQLVLNEAETKIIAEMLCASLDDLASPGSGEHSQRAWRLLVKVDEVVGGSGFLGDWQLELPLWIRQILWRTFNPPQVKAKPKAKAKAKAKAPTPPPPVARRPAPRPQEPRVPSPAPVAP